MPVLASLIDPSVLAPGPTLPSDHPFMNVQLAVAFWSATSDAGDPTDAWLVGFGSGTVVANSKTGNVNVWCVRGGMNAEAY
jgi:hypothetical protein